MNKTKWIWCAQHKRRDYNLTACFKKEFEVETAQKAELRITADSYYRVSLNGSWLNDGPGKAYPEHYTFDVHDIAPLLKAGRNQLEVTARYFGTGTFHQIPQQAGLWAEIEMDGKTICTDSSWQAAPALAWKQWTPRISDQMEAVEEYDARLTKEFDWLPAIETGWTGTCVARTTKLLTKIPRSFGAHSCSTIVKRTSPQHCVAPLQLAHEGMVTSNIHTGCPIILSAILSIRKKQSFNFSSKDWKIAMDGRLLKTGEITLEPGRHAVLFFSANLFLFRKALSFPFLDRPATSWTSWNIHRVDEFLFRGDDMIWFWFENEEASALEKRWDAKIEELSTQWKNVEAPVPDLGTRIERRAEQLFMEDFASEFLTREPLGSAERWVVGEIIQPSPEGDIELRYDLGEQSCGYFDFSIKAEAGVVVDLCMVEYILPDGTIQHTLPFNRNGMRYITQKGMNRFTSLKRRAGQYLLVTLRNQKAPVEIQSIRLIEATAPVEAVGSFECSDGGLTRLWAMSERTLKLCMEDTFTDCPLYEQTLWTGDARNEALYAFSAYGNYEVSARSLELGAQSLERYPMVGCQVPSCWDCLIPAWSFLWGMQVWEHFFHSGDKHLLRKLWPAVQKNLEGTTTYLNEAGLFSSKMWNLLEWAPVDCKHATVLYNSMLLAGVLRAAERCADALGEESEGKKLSARRKKLVRAIQEHWNAANKSYPDAILDNGNPSLKTSQHTSMLAIMCGIEPPDRWKPLLENLIHPSDKMVRVGTPFAMQFMYEALEEAGEFDAVVDSIRTRFQPMIDAGSSTVWEMFPGSDFNTYGFPTRSHCHAWASSPIFFLNRIVLGIRQTAAGGNAFEISPWIRGLTQASGATATPKGSVQVNWSLHENVLTVHVSAPLGVTLNFKSNESHEGLELNVRETHRSEKNA